MLRRKQRKIKKFAKILIAFSITLLLYGAFLDYKSDHKFFNPITDSSTIKGGSSRDGTTIDINSSGELLDKKDTKNDGTSIPTIDGTNDNYRKQIEKRFGITIKYGEETENYEVGGLTTTPLRSATDISIALSTLNTCLSHYPDGLFQEISDGGIPLTIILIERYSLNGVTGVTDSNSYYATISIATAYPFEESFYHESYHYIERFMSDKRSLSFTNWNGYNPPGFVYGEANYELSYTANGGREDSYFVNNYAQSSDSEDRASTFEYMMDDEKASCLNFNQPVWKKAKLMAEAMDAALTSCSPYVVEYWERFL